VNKKEKMITWPRLHWPNPVTWICELGLLLDASICVISFSIIETNFFCSLVEYFESNEENKK